MSGEPGDIATVPGSAPESGALVPVAEPAPDLANFDFDRLTPEVGWMLIWVGVLGVILPGLPGAPFFLAGGAVLVPGAKKRVSGWLTDNPRPYAQYSVKILGRFMDDLDARYPPRA